MAAVFEIYKGVNRSIEFKGIRAQYILYLAVGLVALLLMFAIGYVAGVNIYICLGAILPGGGILIFTVQSMSKKYGAHGLDKKIAARRLPRAIRTRTRRFFITLNTASPCERLNTSTP